MKGLINIAIDGARKLGGRSMLKFKKASPEILIGAGVICVIGATVMACKATKKADCIIEECSDEVSSIKNDEELSEARIRQECTKIKLRSLGKLACVYGPSVALGAAGIAMIFTSHGIMKKRNGALLAAYNALDAAFKQYRDRVRSEEGGLQRDKRYLTGRELITDDTNETLDNMCKESLYLAHARNPWGPYIFKFDPISTKRWSRHGMTNLNTIRGAEWWASNQLTMFGHLFLNDVLDYLDMEKVPWGQFVGWYRGSGESDNLIFLAIEDEEALTSEEADENGVFLDFNCDGVIYDKL